MQEIINNTFNDYLATDDHLEVSDNKSYKFALNVIAEDQDQNTFISNEHSNQEVHKYASRIVGKKYIPKLNSTVILLESSEIHMFSHITLKSQFLASDKEFKCNWNFGGCEWIEVHDYEEYICDTYITFSSNNIYYNINISELLDPNRKRGLIASFDKNCGGKCTRRNCEYFKVFKKSCDPHIETVISQGGNLRNGTYFISGRYYNNQNGTSNPFPLTKGIHIASGDNKAGEISNKKIEITIQNYSCSFDQIQVFIYEIINGVSIAKKLNPRYIDGDNFVIEYTGNEGDPIDLSEILINWRTYIEGEDLLLSNNRSIYYNVKPEFDYNFQPIANQIKTSWYAVKVPLEDIKRYNLTSFMRGETYAFSFTPNYKHGKKGYGFHIPAVNGSGICGSTFTIPKSPFNTAIAKKVADAEIDLGINSSSSIPSSTGSQVSKVPETYAVNMSDELEARAGTSPGSIPSPPTAAGLFLKRIRGVFESTVENPTEEEFIKKTLPILKSFVSEIDDLCDTIEKGCNLEIGNFINPDGSLNCTCGDAIDAACESERRKQLAAQCRRDHLKVEEISSTWAATFSSYIGEEKKPGINAKKSSDKKEGTGLANILYNSAQTVTKLKDAAAKIVEDVNNREYKRIDYKPYSFSKAVEYTNNTSKLEETVEQTLAGSSLFSNNSFEFEDKRFETKLEDKLDIEVQPGIYKTYPIVKVGRTIPKEQSIKYPCNTDCNGKPIYCDLSGKKVTHHQFPFNKDIPFWEPKNLGDGSRISVDADNMDGYGILLGVQFSNINIPPDVQEKLCPTNPFNFGMVKRTGINSSVILKGPASQTYNSSNQGKTYLYEKIGTNSFERASRYIDINGSRIQPGAGTNINNIALYSVDQLLKKPYLNGTHIIKEGKINGTGARHFLYSQGDESRSRRKDQRGAVSTILMSQYVPDYFKTNLLSQIYVDGNTVTSPPEGSSTPFMNKHGQEFAWLSGTRISTTIDDNSFVGDVYQHHAPITDASMEYFTVYKELNNQYGDLSSLNYVNILQSKGFSDTKGLVGDSFIGIHSIIKTHFISEKVGNYFPIGNMVNGKADRCICDDPEDAIYSKIGQYYWKALPKEGDAADAKNWAGLHTVNTTKTWQEASAVKITESDYYYPKFAKFAITYVGESNVNPWLRERGELLQDQVYDNIKAPFIKHSRHVDVSNWEEGYLNVLLYLLNLQASKAQLALKTLIVSTINLVLPALGINDVLKNDTELELTGSLLSTVINAALYIMISQMLYTNEFVDKFLQLDICNKDQDGGEESKIEGYFTNYSGYNGDYSIVYSVPTIVGLPNTYTGCICGEKHINNIYISDENYIDSYVNSYGIVRPNNVIRFQENYGKLTKVYDINSKLFLHTTNGILVTQINNQIPKDLEELFLGLNNIAREPQLITTSNEEGSYGLMHPNHGKLTKYGFVFVDELSKDLIVFNGQDFDVLSSSNYRNSKLFKKYLGFCSVNDCANEQFPNHTYYAFGVDNALNRLLFTKSDGKYSFTMSFDYSRKKWISFHSYIPQEYISDRLDMFTINKNTVYIHNDYTKYCNFYGEDNPMILDFVAFKANYDFSYQSTILDTEAKLGNKREYFRSFNKVQLLNSFQSTGIINLQVEDNINNNANNDLYNNIDHVNTIPLSMQGSKFMFNEVYDYFNGNTIPLIHHPCNPIPVLNQSQNAISRSYSSYKDRVIYDNYLYNRFILDNFAKLKLYVKKIDTIVKITS